MVRQRMSSSGPDLQARDDAGVFQSRTTDPSNASDPDGNTRWVNYSDSTTPASLLRPSKPEQKISVSVVVSPFAGSGTLSGALWSAANIRRTIGMPDPRDASIGKPPRWAEVRT
jgi:hypothetical protein